MPSRPPLVLLLALGTFACGPEPLPTTGSVRIERLASPTLGEELVLHIRTPPSMRPDDRLPLVVQLDPTFAGLRQFEHTAGLVSDRAAHGEGGEAIVVGLDFEDPWRRFEHFELASHEAPLDPRFGRSEGADRLYAALRDEVLPHLEATLPIDPARRFLLGHSDGARFAWYVALRHRSDEPLLFAGVVAADGGIDRTLFELEAWHAATETDLPLRLYATRAAYNGPAQRIPFDALVDRLRGRGHPGLTLEATALETDHGGALVPSYEAGLALVLGSDR